MPYGIEEREVPTCDHVCEYFVLVQRLQTVPLKQAVHEIGFSANRTNYPRRYSVRLWSAWGKVCLPFTATLLWAMI